MVLLTLYAISGQFVHLLGCIWLSILGTERRALGFFWLPFHCLMLFKLNILFSLLLYSLLQHNWFFPSFALVFLLFIYFFNFKKLHDAYFDYEIIIFTFLLALLSCELPLLWWKPYEKCFMCSASVYDLIWLHKAHYGVNFSLWILW